MESNGAKRVKAGVPQVKLAGRSRRKNLHGAFVAQHTLAGRHVAIVDDVVTTTTTISELAHSLRRAGAARVSVWALARVD